MSTQSIRARLPLSARAAEAAVPAPMRELDRVFDQDPRKAFHYLVATSRGIRIRVCITRTPDGFIATGKVGSHVHRKDGSSPSMAFGRLGRSMAYELRKLAIEDKDLFEQMHEKLWI